MSVRDKIADEVERYAWWYDGDINDGYPLDEVVSEIIAAIEAERPAIEAAERERLAKAAEKGAADLLRHGRPKEADGLQWFAEWIRSQGETARP